MGHLSGARTERKINSVEVVSDDYLKVLRFSVDDNGTVTISGRDATESEWNSKTIASVDKDDAGIIATILNGGVTPSYGTLGKRIESVSVSPHSLPKPEAEKNPMDGDCTPLDIERAKAANLKEERELVQLQLERDHALDRHVTADVPGCPACDRKTVNPAGFLDHRRDARPSDDSLLTPDPDDLPY